MKNPSTKRTTPARAFLAAARRLYRNRRATVQGEALFKPDATCTCQWCRTMRDFLNAGSADYQARRYK